MQEDLEGDPLVLYRRWAGRFGFKIDRDDNRQGDVKENMILIIWYMPAIVNNGDQVLKYHRYGPCATPGLSAE